MKQLSPACQSALSEYRNAGSEIFSALSSSQEDISVRLDPLDCAVSLTFEADLDRLLTVVSGVETSVLSATWELLCRLRETKYVSDSWHLISDTLTEQELNGTALSRLAKTIHHLLQNSQGHHILTSENVLEQLFPSPIAYRNLAIETHVGETRSQRDVLTQLVAAGYTRYQSNLEAGGFRVRGEQVDVRTTTQPVWHTISWYGSRIEAITEFSGRRSTRQNRTRFYPVAFPEADTPLGDILQTQKRLIIGATKAATVQTQAASPSLSLPPLPDLAVCRADTTPEPVAYEKGMMLVAELTPGKPAVHSEHGIGLYEGLQTRTLDEQTREYLVLRFAGGDSVSVPVEYAYKVTAYAGESAPALDSLGGTAWQKTRRQAKKEAEEYARELLRVAAKRTDSGGHSYVVSSELDAHLDATFPYSLTPDQETAWAAVKQNIQTTEPMDHLVVGDVGFGKTEIALRAARHVIENGKQVALLAPTTLLVQQHSDTATERLSDIRSRIGTLSRFATSREQQQVRDAIAAGEVSLVIGTHALLSESVRWHNLGLVIIDEEQRFGVKHKEHFKRLRAEVDLLSLSATPIPRTLSMALSGLKHLSVISSPPAGRQPVQTTVAPDSDQLLKSALETELGRGGQVYVVAPKIRHLATLARRVSHVASDARVAIAHGQLAPKELAHIMGQFDRGEVDVLVSSTIIENGIDLPNANTIIVTHATHFGLSDLYQLRGRVGRRKRQGQAYFVYSQGELTFEQRERLTALTEAARLGSGWSVAQRDLELRGAGNLLGSEQSGLVRSIGIQLYLDLVEEAVAKASDKDIERHDVDVALPLSGYIPVDYIHDTNERARYYQRLSRARSLEELQRLSAELVSGFGPLPQSVEHLIQILNLQRAAAKLGISRIEASTVTPSDEDPYARLTFLTDSVVGVVGVLQALGNVSAGNDRVTWDVDEVDARLVQRIIDTFEVNTPTNESSSGTVKSE